MSIEQVMPSNPLILCRPLLLLPLNVPSIRAFSNESVFWSGGQSVGVSASASVLPINIQDWFPIGWTGSISLQSKGDSQESPPTPQFESISSSTLGLPYGLTLTSIHDYWKNHSFDYIDLRRACNVSVFNMLSLLQLFYKSQEEPWLLDSRSPKQSILLAACLPKGKEGGEKVKGEAIC